MASPLCDPCGGLTSICVPGDKGDPTGCPGPSGDRGPSGDTGPSGDDMLVMDIRTVLDFH